MLNSKVFEVLNILKEFSSGREINIHSYSKQTGISERTIRRYLEELRSFFGDESIIKVSKGSYACLDKNFFNATTLPNRYEANESEKLIDLLHVINPGFMNNLPQSYKNIDKKLEKELSLVFLIKGSPHEKSPDIKIFELIKKAITQKRYCDITYDDKKLKNVRMLKIIYCKGNWQVAILSDIFKDNNDYGVIRLSFISEVKILAKTFYIEDYTKRFLENFETFGDGYKKEPYECEVAINPLIEKYFIQKRFLKSQKLDRTLKNGWRVIKYTITNDNMILLLAKRFFPNFIILSPKSARDTFENDLSTYNKNIKSLKR